MLCLASHYQRYPSFHSHLCPLCILCTELLPMTSYFSDIVRDLKERTEIATNALMESEETAEVSFYRTIAQIVKSVFETFREGIRLCSEKSISHIPVGNNMVHSKMLAMIFSKRSQCSQSVSCICQRTAGCCRQAGTQTCWVSSSRRCPLGTKSQQVRA